MRPADERPRAPRHAGGVPQLSGCCASRRTAPTGGGRTASNWPPGPPPRPARPVHASMLLPYAAIYLGPGGHARRRGRLADRRVLACARPRGTGRTGPPGGPAGPVRGADRGRAGRAGSGAGPAAPPGAGGPALGAPADLGTRLREPRSPRRAGPTTRTGRPCSPRRCCPRRPSWTRRPAAAHLASVPELPEPEDGVAEYRPRGADPGTQRHRAHPGRSRPLRQAGWASGCASANGRSCCASCCRPTHSACSASSRRRPTNGRGGTRCSPRRSRSRPVIGRPGPARRPRPPADASTVSRRSLRMSADPVIPVSERRCPVPARRAGRAHHRAGGGHPCLRQGPRHAARRDRGLQGHPGHGLPAPDPGQRGRRGGHGRRRCSSPSTG